MQPRRAHAFLLPGMPYDSHVDPRPSMSSSLSSASLLNCRETTASGMYAFVK